MGWREILPFVAALVGAQRPDVSHAHHNPIVSKNPWLNKNSWFLEVMGGHWNSSNYVINFGAHYETRKPERDIDDVVSEHMRSNAAIGLAVDADDPMKWAGKNIVRRTQFLVPDGVAALLDGAGCPAMPRLLKVDIDSFDVVVVRAVLAVRKPAFVYVEINEKFPPPVCYCNDRYLKRWRRLDGDAYGCSLLGYVEALRPFGYALVSVALNDALFARGDVQAEVARRLPGRKLPTPLAAWKLGYGEVHNIHERFPWNYKNWPFYTETVPMAIRLDAMEAYPTVRKGVAAGQATFTRNASTGSWPCAPTPNAPHTGLNTWNEHVRTAHGAAQKIKGTRMESKRYLGALGQILAKDLGENAPPDPRNAKARLPMLNKLSR